MPAFSFRNTARLIRNVLAYPPLAAATSLRLTFTFMAAHRRVYPGRLLVLSPIVSRNASALLHTMQCCEVVFGPQTSLLILAGVRLSI
jgi:hypothetical protein